MNTKLLPLSSLLLLALAAGCGATTTAPTTSSITGTVDQATFATPVTQIQVSSDGATASVAVEASGRFELVLAPGKTYRFSFAEDGSIPLVGRATPTRLDTTVRVDAAGAHLDLGKVRYWPGAAGLALNTPPPVASQEAAATCEDLGDDDDHECEDGIDPNTGAECDGGPAANQDDGAEGGEDAAEATDCEASDAMALPEMNLPESIGCADEEEDD